MKPDPFFKREGMDIHVTVPVNLAQALLGSKIGKKVIMVAEKVTEVRTIVAVANEMGIEPMMGISCGGMPRWASSFRC